VAIPVYKQLHNSESRRINKLLLRSCTSLSVLYALVASCGAITHGRRTPENILLAYPEDHKAAQVAQALMGCSLLVAMPLNLHAARDQLPEVLRTLHSMWLLLRDCMLWVCCLCLRLGCMCRRRAHCRSSAACTAVKEVKEITAGNENCGRGAAGALATKTRLIYTAVLLTLPAAISLAFPSVTSIVGVATGFGSVLWTFIMPVVMVVVLRRQCAEGKLRSSLASRRCERLLSSPLASPLWSPASSPGGSPGVSPPLSPRLGRSRSQSGSDAAFFRLSVTSGSVDLGLEGFEEAASRLAHLQQESHADRDLEHELPTSQSGSQASGSARLQEAQRGSQHYPWSLDFTLGVLGLAVGSSLGIAAACQSVSKLLSG